MCPLPQPTHLVIRRAVPSDLDAIVALMAELAAYHADLDAFFHPRDNWEEIWRDYLQSQWERPDHLVVVAEYAGEMVGFANAGIRTRPAFREVRSGHIENIVITATHRGRGIGRALTEPILDWFRAQGLSLVEIQTAADNQAGQRFWLRMGFQPVMTQMRLWLDEREGGTDPPRQTP